MLTTYHNVRDLNIHERTYECMFVHMLGYMLTLMYAHVTHTYTTHAYTHIHTHAHTHLHTHTHTHTPHYNTFVHTTLIQPNLSQRWRVSVLLPGKVRKGGSRALSRV